MKDLKSYIKESKGSPLNMRTPDRFNSDPLNKGLGTNSIVAEKKIYKQLGKTLENIKFFGQKAFFLEFPDGDPAININRSKLESAISEYYMKHTGNLTSAQENALNRLDMYTSTDEGPEVYIDDADNLVYQLNKEFEKTAKSKYKYNTSLFYDVEHDCFGIWFDDNIVSELHSAPNAENQKKAEKFMNDVISLITDILDKKLTRIFPK